MVSTPPAPSLPSATLLLGPAKSGKTRAMLELFLNDPSGTLLIVPSREHQRRLARRIAGQNRACFLAGLDTFAGLSQKLLHACKEFHPLWNDAERLWTLRGILRDMEGERKLVFLKGAARSAGFLETLGDFVKELKHAEIFTPALREALRRKGPDPKDQEILELYKRYQEILVREGAYDQEGLLWQAKRLLQRGAKFPGIKTLLVDGFDSFTPTQLLFLQNLARGMEKTVITLPPTLFTHVARSRSELQSLFRLQEKFGDTYRNPNSPAGTPPASQENCRENHRDTRHNPNSERIADPNNSGYVVCPCNSVMLQQCMDMAAEARFCAAQIKRLLAAASPDAMPTIAVYARRLKPYRELLEQEFRRHGLPPARAKNLGAEKSPLWIYLRAFLRAHAHAALEDLLFLWDSPLSAKNPFRKGVARPGMMRRWFQQAGIAECHGDWKTRLGAVCKDGQADAWQAFAASFHGWPLQNNATGHLAELEKRLQDAGFFDCLPADWIAHWEVLSGALRAYADFRDARASAEPSAGPRDLALPNLEEEFLPFLRAARLPANASAAGPCVFLEGEEIRGAAFDAVFLLGLNEGVFPANHREHSLFSAAERLKMIAAGLDLQQDTDKDAQESLLFYQAVASAGKQLFASCHRLDAQQREAMPSPFFRQLLASSRDSMETDSPAWHCEEDTLADLAAHLFLPKAQRPPATEFLKQQWMQRDVLRTRRWMAAAAWERQREYRRGFSDSDAQLADKGLLADARRRYGWDAITSASKINEYASCPHRFYARHVLGLDMPEEPFGELDRRTRGSLIHDILWTLYTRHFQQQTQADTDAAFIAMQQDLPQAANACFEALEKVHGILRPGLWAWEKGAILSQLAAFLAYERQLFAQNPRRRPKYFELSFGFQQQRGDMDSSSTREPLVLRRGNDALRLRGKIDRVDLEEFPSGKGPAALGFWVLDYKSGGKRLGATDIARGKDVQLPVYLFAAMEILQALRMRAQPAGASLISTNPPEHQRNFQKDKKALTSGSLEDEDWEDKLEAARQKIFEYADGISRGRFTPTPPGNTCVRHCEYRGLCRHDERRIARKMPMASAQEAEE